jgi:hypothetical protein
MLSLLGCGTELVYRADLDKQKTDYYASALEAEKNLQKENIAGVQKKYGRAQELCSLLYQRSQARDRNTLLGIALKLYRLSKTMEAFEQMRKNSYDFVRVVFSREDPINKPLQMEFDIEMNDIQEFLLHLAEARVRITYLSDFRQKTLVGDRQEERMENFKPDFQKIQNTLQNAINEKITNQFSNIGIAVTRDSNFKCSAPDAKYVNTQLDDPTVLLPPSREGDINDYEYYFNDEREEFNLYLDNLKAGQTRLKKAIDSFKKERAQDSDTADQLIRTTAIMDDKLAKVEKLYAEIMGDLKVFVAKDVVDKTVLVQAKEVEGEEAAKKSDLEYYTPRLLELSKYLSETLYTGNTNSEASLFLGRLGNIDKDFNQKQGPLSTGYDFLNQEWKEKVSFGKLTADFTQWLKQLEEVSKDSLNPLWKTAQFSYERQGQKPPYRMESGDFKENN